MSIALINSEYVLLEYTLTILEIHFQLSLKLVSDFSIVS